MIIVGFPIKIAMQANTTSVKKNSKHQKTKQV